MLPSALMTCTSFSCGTSRPFHALYTLLILHHALLCISPDGQGYSVWTCQQMSGKYHTQLPSSNVLPSGGWQFFQYSHLT